MKLRHLLIPALAVAGAAYLLAPEKPDAEKTAPFRGRNFAHRGLHTKDGSAPENSLPAFQAASILGFGVELDVHLTADNKVVVFHDDTLERMCGDPRKIEDLTFEELSEFTLAHTECKIPLLTEVFEVLDGAPIILELKRGSRNDLLCAFTLALIQEYKGDICVESFDPFIVGWFKKNAPHILRGQLSCHHTQLKNVSKPTAFMLSNLLTNFIARPNFIAYGIGKKPLTVKTSEKMGAMKVCWTSKSTVNEIGNDAVIFEHYIPDVRFK